MELTHSKEPWTAAVAWARPWHRPATRRPSASAPRANRLPAAAAAREAPPELRADALPDPVKEAAWTAASAELRAAREALVHLDPAVDDPWLAALARQDLFLARRKVRSAQEALTGVDADLPWSTS